MQVERKHVFTLAAAVMALSWVVLTGAYGKWALSHHWFGVAVWIWAGVAFLVTLGFGFATEWVSRPWSKTRYKLLVIVAVGFILCVLAGVGFTEPRERFGAYDYRRTPSGGWYYYYIDPFLGGDSYNADMDEDAFVVMMVFIAVVVLVCASAIVPHFWVVATAALLAIAILLVYRTWMRPRQTIYGQW